MWKVFANSFMIGNIRGKYFANAIITTLEVKEGEKEKLNKQKSFIFRLW